MRLKLSKPSLKITKAETGVKGVGGRRGVERVEGLGG